MIINEKLTNEVANPFLDGAFVVVDKPLGWTSFDVVNKFRRILSKQIGTKKIKVGHAGSLDPLATGVVVVCTGKYTKRIEEVMASPKVYIATMVLGATTPTYDKESEVNATFPNAHITEELLRDILPQFIGIIKQVPPIFSAVKVNGERAYKLARRGEEAQLSAKDINVYDIELLDFDFPEAKLRITCGKGTYIRALARDIGEALDSGAYLSSLRRECVGNFFAENGIKVEDFKTYIESRIEEYNG